MITAEINQSIETKTPIVKRDPVIAEYHFGCLVYVGLLLLGWLFATDRWGVVLVVLGIVAFLIFRIWRRAKLPYDLARDEWERREAKRFAESRLRRRDSMLVISPKDFEVAVARLFSSMGFVARETRYTADGGWDVDVYDGSKRYIVECKQYGRNRPVGRPILQKLHSAMITERANGAMCVTTSHFTVPALQFARDNGIQVFDGNALGDLLCKAFGEPSDNKVFGLCRVCARTASFVPEVGDDNVFSTCPNGHMVKHPLIVDGHPRVSYRMRDLKKAGVWTAG